VDEYREQNWVPDKENRGVVSHKVPDAIFCVELYGKATGISAAISVCGNIE